MDRIGLNLTGFNSGLNSGQFTPQQLAMLLALRATSPALASCRMGHRPRAAAGRRPHAAPGRGPTGQTACRSRTRRRHRMIGMSASPRSCAT